MRPGSNQAEELQAVGDRHPHVEDDCVREDVVGKLQPSLGAERGCHLKTLELEHARERVGDGTIVVDNQDGSGRSLRWMGFGRRNHCIILIAKDMRRQDILPCRLEPGYTRPAGRPATLDSVRSGVYPIGQESVLLREVQ